MNARWLVLCGIPLAAMGSLVQAQTELPAQWGGGPRGYEVRIDKEIKHGGDASVSLTRTTEGTTPRFGTIVQAFRADEFAGKRVRLTGYLKSADVAEHSGLWMRVDSVERGTVAFDNMHNRGVRGTTEWNKHDIVLDVPADSSMITFGAILSGSGKLWVDDLVLTVAPDDVPVTAELAQPMKQEIKVPENLSKAPRNLDFES